MIDPTTTAPAHLVNVVESGHTLPPIRNNEEDDSR
jgi:hypothetical protein